MKIQFSAPRGEHCTHEPKCYLWLTRDKRTIPLCLLEDDHLDNIINSLRSRGGTGLPAYGYLREERYKRRGDTRTETPTTTDLVFAFKALRLEENQSRGLTFQSLNLVWEEETRAFCTADHSHAAVREHLLDEEEMITAHGRLTGCGLYSFAKIGPAIDYTVYSQPRCVALIQLSGVVVDVDFVQPNEPGYLSEKARIHRVWVEGRNLHPDAKYILPHKFPFKIQLIDNLGSLKQEYAQND